ncbi:MAG TPA: S-adenosylmethionine:tRNA ribosyltransferase-isomerase [Actinospica sp.]|jgi:S-adenosylmethionine:tRNA ribosyltransferase-isomerase|nr:S-adenosylmethionine:tRNA ribosyltransferase-isomerase [Actinospica sp.]
MTAITLETGFDFDVPDELTAHEPAEARGLARDGVRMVVGYRGSMTAEHHQFTNLPEVLTAKDLLVVNNSGTLPAALTGRLVDGRTVALHVSSAEPNERGAYLVELRRPAPDEGAARYYQPAESPARVGLVVTLPGRAHARLTERFTDRLWFAEIRLPRGLSLVAYLAWYGKAIRYGYVDREWPIEAYQTVFATEPGSSEMPSAARPFTAELVKEIERRGTTIAPITLHTGVASPEAHEAPYAERFKVPGTTAELVERTRRNGGRVIAIGTTVVRALESAVDAEGHVREADGWTDLIITPERGVFAVDGLLTGWHEPRASHLLMLQAVAGRPLLDLCYAEAIAGGYLWHEFGDVNLLLP